MEQLKTLFADWAGEPCDECLALGANGSNRRYYRLTGATHHCIGTVGEDVAENEAFIAYTRHFLSKGIPVPQLYVVADDHIRYLQQDLGDQTLYGLLYEKKRQGGGFDPEMLALYRQALADLAAIQQAGIDMDYSTAFPRADFDRQSILWDLNYFKYFYLKLAHIPFHEQRLEDDSNRLADFLLQADCRYFLYRDFQGRNIMVIENGKLEMENAANTATPKPDNSQPSILNTQLFYIDYQGGRRGAAQYDVASLLYSAKSDLPEAIRQELLAHYLHLRGIKGTERKQWLQHFWGYLLIRILQTLGAYGYRGLYERKDYFLQSIPLALGNLRRLLQDHPLPIDLPELNKVIGYALTAIDTAANNPRQPSITNNHSPITTLQLTVTVGSFSYKRGLPADPSGNGGGFLFDCRALPNPGRYPEYKAYTGKDRPVIEFLQKEPAVDQFLLHAKALVAQSVEKYLERRFTSLQVFFGCTGGQHRSVYCAEQLARWLVDTYPCNVVLQHREQD